jgi:hypothetical protein
MILRTLAVVVAATSFLGADGIIIPEPPAVPLSIRYHRVRVEIEDQAAIRWIGMWREPTSFRCPRAPVSRPFLCTWMESL